MSLSEEFEQERHELGGDAAAGVVNVQGDASPSLTQMCPCSVNLNAFCNWFVTTCRIRTGSTLTYSGASGIESCNLTVGLGGKPVVTS